MTIQEKTVNAVRILSAEMITKAGSGHPGICMDAAPVGYELYADIMNYNPAVPDWDNRDRFILSAGHGSAMLYSLLHLFGFGLSKEDLQNFRQFGSKTPGHPERGITAGVDCSTGALGQGVASAVGFALAECYLAAKFNREGYLIVDHYTYVLCGEGCLEEGISYEACSFAGRQKLGKLILFYDCNKISIEGNTDDAFADDIPVRFVSQGWQVLTVEDINDLGSIKRAVASAKTEKDKPSIIICHSVIGYGTPNAGTAKAHGTPLTEEQLSRTKDFYNWTEEPFDVPNAVKAHCSQCAAERSASYSEWVKLFEKYFKEFPELAKKYNSFMRGELPSLKDMCVAITTEKPEATRISGGVIINQLAAKIENLLSGSADLSPSTKTDIKGEGWFSPENRTGRNIHFGIREHAMAAICNGIAFHGGLRAICSTFFVFSDYMKGAMRIAAISHLPVIYVLTHDSIGVGEDGPTHQPVEQLAMLRAMPNINVFRPADRAEAKASFISALNSHCPSAIVMSRQNLNQKNGKAENGGYVISDCKGAPDVLLVSAGSEVDICISAQKLLKDGGINARVVSMYCTQIFDSQPVGYINSVLPCGVLRVCVEASGDNIWYKYAAGGKVINMTSFGQSAPMEKLYDYYGFTPQNIADTAKKIIG